MISNNAKEEVNLKKIYCIRHALTDDHVSARKIPVLGFPNQGINDAGIKDAKAVACKLKNLGIQGIVSSDLKSSVDTARIIGDYLKVPIYYTELLRERNQGEFTGKTLQYLRETYENFSITTIGKNREALSDFIKRSRKAFTQIVKDYNWETCMIVSHKGLLQTMSAACFEKKPQNWRLCEMREISFDSLKEEWVIKD